MSLTEIEEQVIKPLTTAEKKQLIRDIQAMLIDEQIEHHGEEMLREMFPPEMVYEIATPNIVPDASDMEALSQLRQEREHAI